MQRARAAIIAIEYLLTLAILWLIIGNWLIANLPPAHLATGTAQIPSATDIATFGPTVIYPNALAFGITAIWFSRRRTFAPLARYLVPSVLAAILTYPVALVILYLLSWVLYLLWPMPRALVLILLCVPATLPGLLTAQLLRWPRVERAVAERGLATPQ